MSQKTPPSLLLTSVTARLIAASIIIAGLWLVLGQLL